MEQKEKTALGLLTPEQLDIKVGELTVRERLHVLQGGDVSILRGNTNSSTGTSLFDLIFGESSEIDIATFKNISNKLKVPTRFQRKFVKDLAGQQSIMTAIFQNKLLNPLYFSLKRTEGIIEIIDGQQRWTTLRNFVNNKFPLGTDTIVMGRNGLKINLGGLTYSQIENELPAGDDLLNKLFNDIYLPVVFYEGTEAQIRQEFINLNTGATGLNKIEILLAHNSNVFSSARKYNDKYNWDVCGIETTRFTAAELILKSLSYQLSGPKKVTIQDLRNLANVSIPASFESTIKDVGSFIDVIPTTARKQFQKGSIRLLIWFLINLRSEYNVIIKDYDKFFQFINQMYLSIQKLKGKIDVGTGKKYWFLYMIARDSSDVITTLSNETNLYLDMKLKECGSWKVFADETGIQLRELERNVGKQQRWEILLNQDSICPECGKIVYLGDDNHHIDHYAVGGSNSVENSRILHKKCHDLHHANDKISEVEENDDDDIETDDI
jgi:5-methylcytosine-specific restriction endonuclease McrA